MRNRDARILKNFIMEIQRVAEGARARFRRLSSAIVGKDLTRRPEEPKEFFRHREHRILPEKKNAYALRSSYSDPVDFLPR